MPTLNAQIFDKTFTTTPAAVSQSVISLCGELSPGQTPVWVTVGPAPGAIAGECFHNVLNKLKSDGGIIVYGWLIWEWPRVYIEAEHHAIWEKDGALIDVTPHVNGEPNVLFLPDPKRIYDYKSKKRLINVKRSLGMFACADRWIAVSDAFQNTLEDHSVNGEIRMNRGHLKAIWEQSRNTQIELLVELALNTKRNDPCFCNSGKKFKKCCALLIDLV